MLKRPYRAQPGVSRNLRIGEPVLSGLLADSHTGHSISAIDRQLRVNGERSRRSLL